MNYEELYKLVLQEKKECKNPCLICHMDMQENYIKLDCNHQFHVSCIFHKKKTNIKQVECPYCRIYSLTSKFINICGGKTNNIKCKLKTFNTNGLCNDHINYIPTTCKAIFKSGKNKGNICGKIIDDNLEYCKRHQKSGKDKSAKDKSGKDKSGKDKSSKLCKAILKSGKNKGSECNNKVYQNKCFCKRHLNKSKENESVIVV